MPALLPLPTAQRPLVARCLAQGTTTLLPLVLV
jgi:hypothetical protein